MKKKLTLVHYKNAPVDDQVIEMLQHSNWIEREMGQQALDDAIEAWKYAVRNRDVTTKYILKIHKLLCREINPRIAGKYRDCDVYIGGHRKIFVSQALLEQELRDFLNEYNNLKKKKELVEEYFETIAQEAHVRFEGIHPFEDGNGRVGRILYNVHRLGLGLPIHIIHEGDEQLEYYSWFKSK